MLSDNEKNTKEWLQDIVSEERIGISWKDREQAGIILSLFDEVERLRTEVIDLNDRLDKAYEDIEVKDKLPKMGQEEIKEKIYDFLAATQLPSNEENSYIQRCVEQLADAILKE